MASKHGRACLPVTGLGAAASPRGRGGAGRPVCVGVSAHGYDVGHAGFLGPGWAALLWVLHSGSPLCHCPTLLDPGNDPDHGGSSGWSWSCVCCRLSRTLRRDSPEGGGRASGHVAWGGPALGPDLPLTLAPSPGLQGGFPCAELLLVHTQCLWASQALLGWGRGEPLVVCHLSCAPWVALMLTGTAEWARLGRYGAASRTLAQDLKAVTW